MNSSISEYLGCFQILTIVISAIAKNTHWGKGSLFTNGAGKIGYPHAK
jgi:hypothetical protein